MYDASTVYLVVARDSIVRVSGDYASAFRADKTALRVSGRFGVGMPHLSRSVRKIAVAAAG